MKMTSNLREILIKYVRIDEEDGTESVYEVTLFDIASNLGWTSLPDRVNALHTVGHRFDPVVRVIEVTIDGVKITLP